MSNKITETRTGVSTVKSEIDGMRSKRDTYMNDMAMLKAQLKDQNQRLVNVAQEKIRVEKWSAESEVKKMNVKQLKDKQTGLKEEVRLPMLFKLTDNNYKIKDQACAFVYSLRKRKQIQTPQKLSLTN